MTTIRCVDQLSEERQRAARARGEQDALRVEEQAPVDPLQRIAWAIGFGKTDQVQTAVDPAREAGCTWRDIGAAIGEHWRNAQTKYGGGRARQRAYRERKRGGG